MIVLISRLKEEKQYPVDIEMLYCKTFPIVFTKTGAASLAGPNLVSILVEGLKIIC